ncbi:hypothetical protein E4U41_006754, partial [Claviceps citrina]
MLACPQSRAVESCQRQVDQQPRFDYGDANFSHGAAGLDKNEPDGDGGKLSSSQRLQPNQRLDEPHLDLSTSGHLIDPLFQDLDRNSRYYLAHCTVCKDLVARDTPSSNPFRELIPLTNQHPLLLQILIATSAIHWSNLFQPHASIPTGSPDPGGYLAQIRSQDLVSRKAIIDALTAKQKAMAHLRGVLDTLEPVGNEVTLAAMHFFVKFDLIDLDRNNNRGWQAHMEGTSSILALIAPDSARHDSSQLLRDCVIADCF